MSSTTPAVTDRDCADLRALTLVLWECGHYAAALRMDDLALEAAKLMTGPLAARSPLAVNGKREECEALALTVSAPESPTH